MQSLFLVKYSFCCLRVRTGRSCPQHKPRVFVCGCACPGRSWRGLRTRIRIARLLGGATAAAAAAADRVSDGRHVSGLANTGSAIITTCFRVVGKFLFSITMGGERRRLAAIRRVSRRPPKDTSRPSPLETHYDAGAWPTAIITVIKPCLCRRILPSTRTICPPPVRENRPWTARPREYRVRLGLQAPRVRPRSIIILVGKRAF